jgi:hypothetical protein
VGLAGHDRADLAWRLGVADVDRHEAVAGLDRAGVVREAHDDDPGTEHLDVVVGPRAVEEANLFRLLAGDIDDVHAALLRVLVTVRLAVELTRVDVLAIGGQLGSTRVLDVVEQLDVFRVLVLSLGARNRRDGRDEKARYGAHDQFLHVGAPS